MRIALRLLLLAAVPVAVLGPAVTWVATSSLEGHLLDHIEESGASLLALQAGALESSFESRLGELNALAETEALESGDLARIAPRLAAAEHLLGGAFEGLYWTTLAGMVHGTTSAPFSVEDRGYYPLVLAGETVITQVIVSRATGQRVVLLMVPVRDSAGRRVGAVGGTMLVESLLAEVERLSVYASGRLLILDEEGGLVVGNGGATGLPDAETIVSHLQDDLAWSRSGFFELRSIDPPLFVQSTPLASPPWRLMVVNPRDVVLADVHSVKRTGILLVAGCLLLAAGIALLLTRTITQPLRRVMVAIRRFDPRGGSTDPLPDDRRDEIGELARSVQVMAGRLAQEESQRQIAETALRQAQKMESLGLMAGSIAHDFNNLLTVIVGNADLARTMIDDPERQTELAAIVDAAERGAALTRRVLAFARQQPANPRQVLLGDALTQIAPVLRRLLPAPITLEVRDTTAPAWVMIDPGQLEQVVMNLVVNARDAMPNGGRILIDVARVEVDATYASLSPGPTEGHHARLVVSDDGEGIGQSSLDRVFEPFFTTKPAGHGTGLGLAICHGIVTQNGGHIRIQSEPGHGTSVTVHLPLTEARSPQEHATLAEPPSQEPRSIFLVEDDAAVRTVLAGSLRSLGHDVIAVGSAEEAMGWMETHGRGRVELAVVDVVLPGRSGPELVELLRQRWPEVAVIYVSGYWQEIASLVGFCTLQKPFRRADLAQAIDQVLDSGEAADAG